MKPICFNVYPVLFPDSLYVNMEPGMTCIAVTIESSNSRPLSIRDCREQYGYLCRGRGESRISYTQ